MRNFSWPLGYGWFEGTLLVLFFVLFVVPVVFIGLWIECGYREAAKAIWEG